MKKTTLVILAILLSVSPCLAGGLGGRGISGGGGGVSTAAEVVSVFGSGSCSGYLKSDGTCDSPAGTGDVTGPASPTTGSIPKWSGTGKGLIDAFALGTLTDAKWCSFATVGGLSCTQNAPMAATKIGTVTNTKYCLGDGSGNIQCTTDPPAGTGDFKADGTVPMTGVLNANVGLKVGNAATGAGYIQLMEDSDNGTDYSSITGTADAGSYPGFIFAGSQGSQTAYLQASSSLWTWHTGASGATFAFTPLITLNAGLAVKNGSTGAGFINIYEDSDDGSNYVAVKAQAMASNYDLVLPPSLGAANTLLGMNSGGTALEFKSTINVTLDNAAAQFIDASAATKKMMIDPSGMTAGKTLTLKGSFDQSTTIDFVNTALSADSKTLTLAVPITDNATYTFPAASATLVAEGVATGGVLLGDSTPDAAGEFGYDSGKFCMYGANSEDLCIEPGNASNKSVISSNTGVTKVGFSALNLVTTGTISGKIPMITKSDDYTLGTDDAQEAYGYMVWMSGNKTLTLPAVSAGMSVCVYSTDATAKMIDPNANDGIRNGTATRNADGHKITSSGAAGDFACLVADSADGWTVLGKSGTWSDE